MKETNLSPWAKLLEEDEGLEEAVLITLEDINAGRYDTDPDILKQHLETFPTEIQDLIGYEILHQNVSIRPFIHTNNTFETLPLIHEAIKQVAGNVIEIDNVAEVIKEFNRTGSFTVLESIPNYAETDNLKQFANAVKEGKVNTSWFDNRRTLLKEKYPIIFEALLESEAQVVDSSADKYKHVIAPIPKSVREDVHLRKLTEPAISACSRILRDLAVGDFTVLDKIMLHSQMGTQMGAVPIYGQYFGADEVQDIIEYTMAAIDITVYEQFDVIRHWVQYNRTSQFPVYSVIPLRMLGEQSKELSPKEMKHLITLAMFSYIDDIDDFNGVLNWITANPLNWDTFFGTLLYRSFKPLKGGKSFTIPGTYYKREALRVAQYVQNKMPWAEIHEEFKEDQDFRLIQLFFPKQNPKLPWAKHATRMMNKYDKVFESY